MDKTLIANIDKKNVYLINEETISFYISMPAIKDNNNSNISIVINLINEPNNINPKINEEEKIKNEITNIYINYHNSDIAVITPIVDSNIVEQIKLNNDEKIFAYTDKIISYLINKCYKILTSEEFSVNKIIKLNNNQSYSAFNDWFIKKYNGRVELVDYSKTPINNINNINNNPIQDNTENSEAQEIANNVLENTNTLDQIDEDMLDLENDVREPGFVSYVLLGVVVVVISLIILYTLL